jgi:hypothetical protein
MILLYQMITADIPSDLFATYALLMDFLSPVVDGDRRR